MKKVHFKYIDGSIMHEGDRVCHNCEEFGTIIKILVPGTVDARDYSMPEGGVLVEYDNIGLAVDRPSNFKKVDHC